MVPFVVSMLKIGSSANESGLKANAGAATGAGVLCAASLLPLLQLATRIVAINSKLINLVFIFFVF